MHDVIIVGGGVIGLSIARELAIHGRSVLVLDRGNPRDATSWAAAGMLAPQSEADGSSPLFNLCLVSARLYRDWVDQLHEESGVDPEYADPGLLVVASTDDAMCRLQRTLEWQRALGLRVEFLSADEAIRLESRLTLPLKGALLMPDECQVTPRRLLEALTGACSVKRVEIRTGVRVLELEKANGRVTGVRTATDHFAAPHVVVASGVRSAEIEGLVPPIPVSPRKGQILSLAGERPTFSRMIRWDHAYVVPRRGGELIVGATNEDAGYDRSITPAGVGVLLSSAQQISSHLANLPITEIWTGLRPATPDSLPVIGRAGIEGLVYATGHYRNGILLAPITAVSVASIMDNRPASVALEAVAPSRFAV
jgi:glycine oxidase